MHLVRDRLCFGIKQFCRILYGYFPCSGNINLAATKQNTAKLCAFFMVSLIARFMGPTWGPSGAAKTHVGPMLVPCHLGCTVYKEYPALWPKQRHWTPGEYIYIYIYIYSSNHVHWILWNMRTVLLVCVLWWLLYHTEAKTKWPPFLQTTFSNAFSWMEMCEFGLKFHWSVLLRAHKCLIKTCQHYDYFF